MSLLHFAINRCVKLQLTRVCVTDDIVLCSCMRQLTPLYMLVVDDYEKLLSATLW